MTSLEHNLSHGNLVLVTHIFHYRVLRVIPDEPLLDCLAGDTFALLLELQDRHENCYLILMRDGETFILFIEDSERFIPLLSVFHGACMFMSGHFQGFIASGENG